MDAGYRCRLSLLTVTAVFSSPLTVLMRTSFTAGTQNSFILADLCLDELVTTLLEGLARGGLVVADL